MSVWLVHWCNDNDYYVYVHDLEGVYSTLENARAGAEAASRKMAGKRTKIEWDGTILRVGSMGWYEIEESVVDASLTPDSSGTGSRGG